MKMVKSLLLGSAAGLAAVAGAEAADQPGPAKVAEQSVKVCAGHGDGYYYIPGTRICLKIGGYVREDVYVNAVGVFNPAISSVAGTIFNGPGGGIGGFPYLTKDSAHYISRTRVISEIDARYATDYGDAHAFIRAGAQYDSQSGAGATAGVVPYIERAFLQFAGLTTGYTQSFFDPGRNYMMTTPYAGSSTWTALAAYTGRFGNGLSATISLEDAANRTTGVMITAPISSATGITWADGEAGRSAPEIVSNLRLDQAWGTAQIAGALHQIHAMTPTPVSNYLGASSMDSWGWAANASAEFKLPMLAPDDSLALQVGYADGAPKYLGLSGSSQATATALGSVSLGSLANKPTGGAFYPIADAIWTGTRYSRETGWLASGQFRHFWVPGLRSAAYAGYVSVTAPPNNLNAYDVNVRQVGLNTIWSPMSYLDLGIEVLYSSVDGAVPLKSSGGSASTVPTVLYGGSTNVWSGGVRAQLSF